MEREQALQAKYERVADYLGNSEYGQQIKSGEVVDYTPQAFFDEIDSACRDLDLDAINLVTLRGYLTGAEERAIDHATDKAIISACTRVLNLSIIHSA